MRAAKFKFKILNNNNSSIHAMPLHHTIVFRRSRMIKIKLDALRDQVNRCVVFSALSDTHFADLVADRCLNASVTPLIPFNARIEVDHSRTVRRFSVRSLNLFERVVRACICEKSIWNFDTIFPTEIHCLARCDDWRHCVCVCVCGDKHYSIGVNFPFSFFSTPN